MALKLEIAQEILLKSVEVMPREQVPLEACRQRVLAEDVKAGEDFPPFDRSPLDGYAVIAAEVEAASPEKPVLLAVIDNIPAGRTPARRLLPGTAARIMTGAPVPEGATGIVRVEDTRTEGDQVAIYAGAGVDKNICLRGEEIVAGEWIVRAGSVINAGVAGMLALMGNAMPWVYRKPRVAILATGNEIVPLNAPLVPGCIRNSNSYMIGSQVGDIGQNRCCSALPRTMLIKSPYFLKKRQSVTFSFPPGGSPPAIMT